MKFIGVSSKVQTTIVNSITCQNKNLMDKQGSKITGKSGENIEFLHQNGLYNNGI